MRPAAGVLALAGMLVLSACASSSGAEGPPAVGATRIAGAEAERLEQVGRLQLRAAFVLASNDPRFGGLSGLWLAPGGERLIAVSDRGLLWLAELTHAPDGTLIGIGEWRAIEPAAPNRDGEATRDAEALAAIGDDLVIAYEGAHRLGRVPLSAPDAAAAALPLPPDLIDPHNQGIEALVDLDDGALLAIAEGVRGPRGDLVAWLIRDGESTAASYAAAPGFAPTGADRLDGTIYVLERRFSLLSGLSARVAALDAGAVRPGARLVGRELAILGPPAISENFEALAARAGPDGSVLLYLLTDDNFMPLFRTVLLQFTVLP